MGRLGLDFSGKKELVTDPVQPHRGWPGVGFTHSLTFALVGAGIIMLLSKHRIWAISFLIGRSPTCSRTRSTRLG